MIGCTKLLCGTATVSDTLKYQGGATKDMPHELMQFSTEIKPVVVWNMTRRCNLRCKHCYIEAEDKKFEGELSTEEAQAFLNDLAEYKIPVVLFSGGEPLLREDFYELGKFANDKGLRVVVSTNGTLITKEAAEKMVEAGFKYIGVSLDGLEATHNKFRGVKGAFKSSIAGVKNALAAGLNCGVRFTITKYNYEELEDVLDYVAKEGIPRFCMYHLVYAGRGKNIADGDLTNVQRRNVMKLIVDKTKEFHTSKLKLEILTVDNHADGIYLYNHVKKNSPERTAEVLKLLEMHGGCSAGAKIGNVDNLGNVHPCQFWGHLTIGNVRERKFSEIWCDTKNEFLNKMRNKASYLRGKCAQCEFKHLCGGCRIRAETALGDLWEEDPACYLSSKELRFKIV